MRTLLPLLAFAALSAEDTATTFAQIKPILDTACVSCHGPKKAKHDLRLDTVEGVLKGGKKLGAGVVSGKPDESPLVKVLTLPRTEKLAMPPEGGGDPLSQEQMNLIKKWITDGAKP
jgi:mono/diheme cytochrome c family protein